MAKHEVSPFTQRKMFLHTVLAGTTILFIADFIFDIASRPTDPRNLISLFLFTGTVWLLWRLARHVRKTPIKIKNQSV